MSSAPSQLLERLLAERTIAALGTVHEGKPHVSMAPFAIATDGSALLIHVSRLAAHTQHMLANPAVSLLIVDREEPSAVAQALARVSLQGEAQVVAWGGSGYELDRTAYLGRFPATRDLFDFSDFHLFRITIGSARVVGGFAQAITLHADAFVRAARAARLSL